MDQRTAHDLKILDADQLLQTPDPDYAPLGLLELIKVTPQCLLDLGCFSLNGI